MKKVILSTLLAIIFSFVGFGQNDNSGALKFLGIPIDGTEAQFANKLRNKGFTYNSFSESYQGQFNGQSVDVYIHCNHDVVDRVYVAFPSTTEDNIRMQFNRLLNQFEKNGKYLNLSQSEEIPAEDDISYEIIINDKRYQASFSYFDPNRDTLEFAYACLDAVAEFYTEDELKAAKEAIRQYIESSEEQQSEIIEQVYANMQKTELAKSSGNTQEDAERVYRYLLKLIDAMRSLADGEVWFMIHQDYGHYQIGLYYDNLHNQAHGEDL